MTHPDPESPLTPAQPDAARARRSGLLLWTLVLVPLLAFLIAMAWLEPITGDCWQHLFGAHRSGVSARTAVRALIAQHQSGNPRIGQLVTFYTCNSTALHVSVTPFVVLGLFGLVLVHALGRAPKLTTGDATLFAFGAACCWLATPLVGQTFFYRPVTGNYVYSLAVTLLFFIPHRLGARVRSAPGAVAAAIGALALGLVVGKTNEHTGPTIVLVAALYAIAAARRKNLHDVVWTAAGAFGTLVGFLFLFFAPGQERRYRGIGKQSPIDTVLDRGLEGTAALLAEFAGYLAPLLSVCALLVLGLGLRGAWLERSQDLARARAVAASYVCLALAVLGTSLAAPLHHYRLFIAPAVLSCIALLVLVSQLRARVAERALLAVALVAHVGFAVVIVPKYRRLHREWEARAQMLEAAPEGSVAQLPGFRYTAPSALFYGDTAVARHRTRELMAKVYGVRAVVVVPWEAEKTKRKRAKRERARRAKRAPAQSPDIEPELP